MAGEAVLDVAGLQALIDALRDRGYTVLGPTVRDGAVGPALVASVDDLPRGWGDEQDAGRYRLHRRGDDAMFGYASGAQSLKPVLFPAHQLLWRGQRTADGFTVEAPSAVPTQRYGSPPYALLGVRSCDLHAIGIHDEVLMGRAAVDDSYASARRDAFVVAVACSDPAGTCFCVSMGTGPRPDQGYDLRLTEIATAGEVDRFLLESGSDRGLEVLTALPAGTRAAQAADREAADRVTDVARARMGRTLDTDGLREALYAGVESPRWDDVASRCLACTNCTMVCPTCFCTSVEDETDLTGDEAARWRSWDSCFTGAFSHLHGGSVRSTVRSRYRQWATHKLASWHDQFGSSGCVGCGRCIAWCPAAIDITAEAAAVRADPGPGPGRTGEGT